MAEPFDRDERRDRQERGEDGARRRPEGGRGGERSGRPAGGRPSGAGQRRAGDDRPRRSEDRGQRGRDGERRQPRRAGADRGVGGGSYGAGRPRRDGEGRDGRRSFEQDGGGQRSGDRRPFGGDRRRDERGDRGQGGRGPQSRPFGGRPRVEGKRERPAHNPRDLRAANRPDQDRSPDIDPDVTGQELDRGTLKEIGGLDERQAGWVSKHLVMAGRYLEEDPALAFQHALAASRKGGRLSRVREAVALTAYAAGEYGEALREFRTYRRMTGDSTHLAAQVDCERALGRHEKALQLAAEADASELDRAARVELAMVVSGVREDLGDLQGAHDALQIPELDRRRGFPFSPRLFQRQADVLAALGRREEAAQWQRSVRVAEKALGIGGFAEPEIVDIDVEPVEEDRRGRRDDRPGRSEDRSRARRGHDDERPAREEGAAGGHEAPQETHPAVATTPSEPAGEPASAADAADEPVGDPQAAAVEHDPHQLSLFDAPEEEQK